MAFLRILKELVVKQRDSLVVLTTIGPTVSHVLSCKLHTQFAARFVVGGCSLNVLDVVEIGKVRECNRIAQQLSPAPLIQHIRTMKRRLVALKARISPSDRNKSETMPNWQSPVLDNARTACQLLANLGSGTLGIPGLQAAGQVAIQIIDIIKVGLLYIITIILLMDGPQKTRVNKADCEDLVSRIVQLLDPLRKALENQNATDIDLRLKEDLERFIQYVP